MKNINDIELDLNNEIMDILHLEFVNIYNSVDLDSMESIRSSLEQLRTHSIYHFEIEEGIMNSISYPTKREHICEHNKILAEMQYFIDMKSNRFGQDMIKSYYTQKLPEWFDLHLMTMDSDLASYIKRHEDEEESNQT